ncbi:MAG: cation:proton antiporter [Acidobacteria bacterium]|nr:cation:proton antiporter [Acidobacteriota bacterium]
MPEVGLLRDLLLLIGLAIPIVALAHRVNAPPLVGFFVAGFVVGPYGLALIDGPDQIETLSELGVALLLFAVGLELSLAHVRQWARSVFIGGGLQVGATLACVSALALAVGIPLSQALFYGALVAMSSTAIVTKAYADRGELDTPHGRSVLSILVFQDLCVLPLILLLPLLADAGKAQWTTLTLELGRGLAIMTLLVTVGRLVVKWTLDRVVLLRDRELFTLCIGFFGIGVTLVTSTAGFSIAIGAFIAGLIISESEYGLQALSDVLPFRALFSGIFFTSLGMLLDIPTVLDQFFMLVALAGVLLVVKVAFVSGGVLAVGGTLKTALISGLSLAQIGEFSFVLAAVGGPLGLFRDGDYQVFLTAAVLSMMATPFLIRLSRPAAEQIGAWIGRPETTDEAPAVEALHDHTVIVGYGLAGRYLARVLKAAGISCLVVEQNAELVRRAREDGVSVSFGDGTRHAVLEHVRLAHARIIVFTISSPIDERRGVALARDINPSVRILVRTRYVRGIDDLIALGTTDVVVEEFEASLVLFAKTLESYEIPINRIWREVESVRTEHYGLLRGTTAPNLTLDALKHLGIHEALELIEIEEGSAVVGANPTSLELRRRTGAVQIAVVRDGTPIYQRDAAFTYRVGDTVVLVGDADSLGRAMTLFRSGGVSPDVPDATPVGGRPPTKSGRG